MGILSALLPQTHPSQEVAVCGIDKAILTMFCNTSASVLKVLVLRCGKKIFVSSIITQRGRIYLRRKKTQEISPFQDESKKINVQSRAVNIIFIFILSGTTKESIDTGYTVWAALHFPRLQNSCWSGKFEALLQLQRTSSSSVKLSTKLQNTGFYTFWKKKEINWKLPAFKRVEEKKEVAVSSRRIPGTKIYWWMQQPEQENKSPKKYCLIK